MSEYGVQTTPKDVLSLKKKNYSNPTVNISYFSPSVSFFHFFQFDYALESNTGKYILSQFKQYSNIR